MEVSLFYSVHPPSLVLSQSIQNNKHAQTHSKIVKIKTIKQNFM